MASPLLIPELVEEWLMWANWQADRGNDGMQNDRLIGFGEFDWISKEHPEHAWQGILATLADPRSRSHLALLAAGPLEGLLSYHGPAFIERVEQEAAQNPAFASLLGGVWQFEMTDEIWGRVRAIWDRRDGTEFQ